MSYLALVLGVFVPLVFGADPAAKVCEAGSEKYWALDTPNNECAEACLATKVQRVEFWVLTGGKGAAAGNESHPCADHGYHTFNRTDLLGTGKLRIALDKYLPDSSLQDVRSKSDKCALACTVEAIGVYWACAADCIEKQAPDSCITEGCLAATTAYDVPCLKKCNKTSNAPIMAAAMATASAQDAGACCQGPCKDSKNKYFSIADDSGPWLCGETCIRDSFYWVFHLFEKNLTKASNMDTCKDAGYTKYKETVTHGGGGLDCTLDLYECPTGDCEHPSKKASKSWFV